MDALSETLRSGRLSRGVFLRAEFTEPWKLVSAVRATDCSARLGPTDPLVVEAVRSYVDALDEDLEGLFAALRDPSLSRAVALLHRHPERTWTVEDLARTAGASRSNLTDKFRTHLGSAPGEYPTRHRMSLAARALESGSDTLLAIARSVGYGSEAAFSRAFKRIHGVPPSSWRALYRRTL